MCWRVMPFFASKCAASVPWTIKEGSIAPLLLFSLCNQITISGQVGQSQIGAVDLSNRIQTV